jgi:hypothetical protein
MHFVLYTACTYNLILNLNYIKIEQRFLFLNHNLIRQIIQERVDYLRFLPNYQIAFDYPNFWFIMKIAFEYPNFWLIM